MTDKKRARLLDQLAAINSALAEYDALPDMTVAKAADHSTAYLLQVVKYSAKRLSDIVEMSRW